MLRYAQREGNLNLSKAFAVHPEMGRKANGRQNIIPTSMVKAGTMKHARFRDALCPSRRAIALVAFRVMPTWAIAQEVLPRPEQRFKGHIGRTAKDSRTDVPEEVQAPRGRAQYHAATDR